METSVLASGLGLFFCGLALHVVVWNVRRPRRPNLGQLSVFLPPLFVFTFCGFWTRGIPANWTKPAATLLLYVSLVMAYMQTYPAVQLGSPSLRILMLLRKRRPGGMTEKELSDRLFDRSSFFADRVGDLIYSGIVTKRADGRLRLEPHGLAMILPLYMFRKLLGLERGLG